MPFATEESKGVKIIRVKEKRLDTTVAPHLKAELILLLSKEPYKIVVDLQRVEYADSSGLGALLLGLRQARDKNGGLVMLNAQKRVKDLLHIARLDEVLQVFESEEEAVKHLNAPAP